MSNEIIDRRAVEENSHPREFASSRDVNNVRERMASCLASEKDHTKSEAEPSYETLVSPPRPGAGPRGHIRETLPVYEVRLVRRGKRKPAPAVKTSQALHDLIRPYFAGLDREHLMVFYLDTGLHPIGCKLESIGSATQCLADIRLIVRDALLANASHLALAHNHPSDTCQPSPEDRALTNRVREAMTAVGITFVDHLIICIDRYYSFTDNGLIQPRLP